MIALFLELIFVLQINPRNKTFGENYEITGLIMLNEIVV